MFEKHIGHSVLGLILLIVIQEKRALVRSRKLSFVSSSTMVSPDAQRIPHTSTGNDPLYPCASHMSGDHGAKPSARRERSMQKSKRQRARCRLRWRNGYARERCILLGSADKSIGSPLLMGSGGFLMARARGNTATRTRVEIDHAHNVDQYR